MHLLWRRQRKKQHAEKFLQDTEIPETPAEQEAYDRCMEKAK
jgi:hypothetical protein